MKSMQCDSPNCREMVEVPDDFKYEFCCLYVSMENPCGCMGWPINPVFCDACESKLGTKQDE